MPNPARSQKQNERLRIAAVLLASLVVLSPLLPFLSVPLPIGIASAAETDPTTSNYTKISVSKADRVAVSDDDRYIYSATQDDFVLKYDTDGNLLENKSAPSDYVFGLAAGNGSVYVTTSQDKVLVYDKETLTHQNTYSLPGSGYDKGADYHDGYLYVANGDLEVHQIDVSDWSLTNSESYSTSDAIKGFVRINSTTFGGTFDDDNFEYWDSSMNHLSTVQDSVSTNTGSTADSYDTFSDGTLISHAGSDFYVYGDVPEKTSLVTGEVTDKRDNPIENATVEFNAGNTTTTNQYGEYSINVPLDNYTVEASHPEYIEETKTLNVTDESDRTLDFTLRERSDGIRFQVATYLKHGNSDGYTVSYQNETTGEWNNVTLSATVTSNDTDVITVDQTNALVTATSNRSINERVNVTASYKDRNKTVEITVANLTVNNIDVLPPTQKVSASLGGGTDENPGDRTVLVVLVATMIGAATALIATSLAGIGIIPLIYVGAWIAGFVGIEIATMSVMISLFIGLNIAANIDYQVTR